MANGLMKTCRTCGVEKALEFFVRRKKSSDGREGTCILCKRAARSASKSKSYSSVIDGVTRDQVWRFDGRTVKLTGVMNHFVGGIRATYHDGKRNRTIPIAWLIQHGERIDLAAE